MAKPYRNTQVAWIYLVPLVVLVPFVVVMTTLAVSYAYAVAVTPLVGGRLLKASPKAADGGWVERVARRIARLSVRRPGLTLAGVTTTSVVCPVDEPGHLLWGHVIPGLGFMVAAIVLGRWVHARQRRTGER